MTDPRTLAGKVAEAVAGIDGLRPATSLAAEISWLPTDPSGGAVDVAAQGVEVRLIALRLPLPPLLTRAEAAVREALAGTEWAEAHVCLVVSELADTAFDE